MTVRFLSQRDLLELYDLLKHCWSARLDASLSNPKSLRSRPTKVWSLSSVCATMTYLIQALACFKDIANSDCMACSELKSS